MGGGGGGGYIAVEKKLLPVILLPLVLFVGLRGVPGWDGACVLCASWHTRVTKSENVSWPFS